MDARVRTAGQRCVANATAVQFRRDGPFPRTGGALRAGTNIPASVIGASRRPPEHQVSPAKIAGIRPRGRGRQPQLGGGRLTRSGGLRPRGPPSPSLAGPRDPRSAPAGAPVARLARYATSSNEYKVLVSSRITG